MRSEDELSAYCYHSWLAYNSPEAGAELVQFQGQKAWAEEPPLVFVDTETTGLSPKQGDRVIENALYRLDSATGEIVDLHTLLNPEGRRSSPQAQAVHQIPPEELEGAPRFAEVAPRVLELLEGAVVVGHNTSFDLRFLKAELERAGRPWEPGQVLDTRVLAKRLWPGMPNYRLQDLAEALRLERGAAHRAAGDVQTTMALWWRIRGERPEAPLHTLARL
jgi:DNA polymerase III epsilon subunit family exonuclease